MKKGDKVWTWNYWKKLIQIEIRAIEYCDGMNVVNGEYPIEWCARTKSEAKTKLLEHIQNEIQSKKSEISWLKEKYAVLSSE